MRSPQPAVRAASWRILAAGVCLAALGGCGYVGDPLPPSLHIPLPARDLSAAERGDRIEINFTIPGATTDGVAFSRVAKVDLRIGPAEGGDLAQSGRSIEVATEISGPARAIAPVRSLQEWIGREVAVGVRFAGRSGRFSEWSNIVRLHLSEPLATPVVAAESAPRGVRLAWRGDAPREGLAWRIFRRAAEEKTAAQVAQSETAEFVDATAEYGRAYEYAVQAFLASGAESEVSQPAAITPVDSFAPAQPSGLTAVAAAHSIEISWEPSTEPDLKGYYLYRWTEGAEARRAGEMLDAPAYSDRQIKSGTQYSYAVSAVDQRGNESARSAPVQATAQ